MAQKLITLFCTAPLVSVYRFLRSLISMSLMKSPSCWNISPDVFLGALTAGDRTTGGLGAW